MAPGNQQRPKAFIQLHCSDASPTSNRSLVAGLQRLVARANNCWIICSGWLQASNWLSVQATYACHELRVVCFALAKGSSSLLCATSLGIVPSRWYVELLRSIMHLTVTWRVRCPLCLNAACVKVVRRLFRGKCC